MGRYTPAASRHDHDAFYDVGILMQAATLMLKAQGTSPQTKNAPATLHGKQFVEQRLPLGTVECYGGRPKVERLRGQLWIGAIIDGAESQRRDQSSGHAPGWSSYDVFW
jgi:hypothetical protein